jgi:chitin synthase
VQSMAGLSMWGGGSVYDYPQNPPGNMHPQMTGMSGGSPMMAPMHMGMLHQQPNNPFDSPMTMPIDANGRQSGYYPQYPAVPSVMGMGAPRGSVMTNLGGYGMMGPGAASGGMPRGASTYSLATTNHPLAPAPQVNPASSPGDEEVVSVLRRYLATQDLMSV